MIRAILKREIGQEGKVNVMEHTVDCLSFRRLISW